MYSDGWYDAKHISRLFIKMSFWLYSLGGYGYGMYGLRILKLLE